MNGLMAIISLCVVAAGYYLGMHGAWAAFIIAGAFNGLVLGVLASKCDRYESTAVRLRGIIDRIEGRINVIKKEADEREKFMDSTLAAISEAAKRINQQMGEQRDGKPQYK